MTTYLVTGGAGFIGHTLANRLAKEGHRVIALDNERSGSWERVDVGVERDPRGIEELSLEDWRVRLQGVDVLFHLAAEKYNSSNSTPERLIDVNVVATERLFRAAAGVVDKIVFTSSLYAYGSLGPSTMVEDALPAPITYYGASKLMGEHILASLAHQSPLAWTVARLFFIYGPRQFAEGGYKSVIMTNFERLAKGLPPTICGDGEQSLDYVYVDDCVDALMSMTDHRLDGEVFNVGTGIGTDINTLTRMMQDIAGDEGPAEFLPADWTAGSRRVGDPAKLVATSSWAPKTDLRTGLKNVWSWLNEQD